PLSPRNRPATTHVVPPWAGCPSGHRMVSAPPQGPARTTPSATPPVAETGSVSWTITERVSLAPGRGPGAPHPLHRPAQEARCSRSALAPHNRPATHIKPTAAPSGARRTSTAVPSRTSSPAYGALLTAYAFNAVNSPAPNAIVR